MLATDLDGTLLNSRSELPAANRDVLEELGQRGVTRVIVTGRSLYSARAVVDTEFPIDYLVFSSGSGVMNWRTQKLEETVHVSARSARRAIQRLVAMDLCFMIHDRIPENHRFDYRRAASSNPDFERRIERYRQFARCWEGRMPDDDCVCQLLVIEANADSGTYERLRSELSELSVVRTTSPLDHQSRWIEIFAPTVSKSQAARRLCQRHGLDQATVVAVGNDYNDEDLLAWAARAFVVDNAPEDLKALHTVVPSNDAAGFASAARVLLDDRD